MFAKGLRHRRPGFDLVFDIHHQARETCIAVPARDDLERLQQRHARLQHRRQLAREKRDVLFADLAPATKALLANLDDADALPPQVGRDDSFRRRLRFAAYLAVVAVDSLPKKGVFLDVAALCSCCGHGNCPELTELTRHSLVIASISSREVMPVLTFSKPDRRRSRMPSLRACTAMSRALPLRMITWRISSVIGMT